MTQLHVLNDDGLRAFRTHIESPEAGTQQLPLHLRDDSRYSQPFNEDIDLPVKKFSSKLDLARALDQTIPASARPALFLNVGAWTWMALLYLDQLVPSEGGRRKFGKAYRYILSADYRHVYRHLIAGPYYIYQNHKDYARTLLSPHVSTHGDFAEQLGSRVDFITNRALIQTVDALYCDSRTGKTKRGATNRKKGGTLRRLIAVIQQLERTYDLYGMEPGELLGLLPREFEPWRGKPV